MSDSELKPIDLDTEVISEEMAKICAEIPTRMNVRGILQDAYARFTACAPQAPADLVAARVSDVLREIATHAVEEFTRRTGQPFLWVDEPDPAENPDNVLMSFGLDEKGNVTF